MMPQEFNLSLYRSTNATLQLKYAKFIQEERRIVQIRHTVWNIKLVNFLVSCKHAGRTYDTFAQWFSLCFHLIVSGYNRLQAQIAIYGHHCFVVLQPFNSSEYNNGEEEPG
jgi:hypothetical protein